MSTKINVAAFATVLTILAVPSVVSARQGYANYGSFNSTEATSNRSQPKMNRFKAKMNRFKAKVPSNAYGSTTVHRPRKDVRQASLTDTGARSRTTGRAVKGGLEMDRIGRASRMITRRSGGTLNTAVTMLIISFACS